MMPVTQQPVNPDWLTILQTWGFAHGGPVASGRLKHVPEDFQVIEQMDVEPSGNGEHIWLYIRKCCQNTDAVARQLAKFSKVAYRDVGYSGLKDHFAVTEQWFSVWLPRGEEPDWAAFEMAGVVILKCLRHHRKIRRGTHRANFFRIVVRDFAPDRGLLQARLNLMQECGIPNYFGPQRFGNNAGNMQQARAMLSGGTRVNNRNLRGLLLSAARSWLFNTVLSARLKAGTWQTLHAGEPANLDGSASVFSAEQSALESDRLLALDIHPTAPMWGVQQAAQVAAYRCLHEWEVELLGGYRDIADGLCAAQLAYQRRPLRMVARQLHWHLQGEQLEIEFSLLRGQFATSVLRELVAEPQVTAPQT